MNKKKMPRLATRHIRNGAKVSTANQSLCVSDFSIASRASQAFQQPISDPRGLRHIGRILPNVLAVIALKREEVTDDDNNR